jgi:hypothetical protein
MATLSARAADALRATLPALADEIIAAIAAEVPDYARAMEGRFARGVRYGVEVALSRFVGVLAGDPPEHGPRDTYVQLGAGEYRSGRSLNALLAAYRVGARLAWRRVVEAGTEEGFPPDQLYDLGEAIFAYIDEISAESVTGFAEAQSEAAGESQRRRRELLRLLTQEPPAAEENVRLAAESAGWTLPRALAAVVAGESSAEDNDAIAARLARRIGPGALGAAVGTLGVVLLPDPEGPGRRRALEAALGSDRAALGPSVPWPECATSLRRAGAAYRLSVQGRLSQTGQSLIVADEHLPALLLAAEPALAADLARTRLAPLEGLAAGPRGRLVATLRAWLDRPGQVQAVAAALDVHPQTVRYRLKQLRELFGARLEDPEARFELALALRAAEGLTSDSRLTA